MAHDIFRAVLSDMNVVLHSDLEKSVEELQRNSSVNHGLVTEQDVEQKSKELRMLGETLTELKSECAFFQSFYLFVQQSMCFPRSCSRSVCVFTLRLKCPRSLWLQPADGAALDVDWELMLAEGCIGSLCVSKYVLS